MLDDYYPKALQWCTMDDIPEDIVSIDICKCYPSILLHNEQPIPVFSIHNTVEPFESVNDLKQCGFIYVDETIINHYSSPIKIEAGFYTSNLV